MTNNQTQFVTSKLSRIKVLAAPNTTLLNMKALTFVIASFISVSTIVNAQVVDEWSIIVKQKSKLLNAQPSIKIKKAPFELIFQGPKQMGYAVLASNQCDEISILKNEKLITEAIRPTNITIEPPDRTYRTLVVNDVGSIKSGDNAAQVWLEDEVNKQYNFQHVEFTVNGRAVATREINEIELYTDFKTTKTFPIQQYPGTHLCMLLTGLPPVGRMAHIYPKIIKLEFELK